MAQAGPVSVVIPCFNQAHYLGEAIESVLSQTIPGAEIIVVDDGSVDHTYEVAGRYGSVHRMRQKNRGVAAARNAGLAASSGEELVFLDADDRLMPRALETGTTLLRRRPNIAFVSGAARDIRGDGSIVAGPAQAVITQDHYLRLLETCFILSGSSIVYRRSAVEAVGGFDESLSAADDYDLYLRLARRFAVYCHGGLVTEYRRHGTNTTRDPAIVLDSQLEVLGRQRGSVSDARERRARRSGLRHTRREHGAALAERVSEEWRRGQRRTAFRGLGTLIRCSPRALGRIGGTPWS